MRHVHSRPQRNVRGDVHGLPRRLIHQRATRAERMHRLRGRCAALQEPAGLTALQSPFPCVPALWRCRSGQPAQVPLLALAGTYSAAGFASCATCTAGLYSTPGSSSCSLCPVRGAICPWSHAKGCMGSKARVAPSHRPRLLRSQANSYSAAGAPSCTLCESRAPVSACSQLHSRGDRCACITGGRGSPCRSPWLPLGRCCGERHPGRHEQLCLHSVCSR